MCALPSHVTGVGAGGRRAFSRPTPRVRGHRLPVQASHPTFPSYPFQPLPPPNGPAPYRFDLSNLLPADEVNAIKAAGKLVFHTVGDTGDYRGNPKDMVAYIMTQDFESLAADSKPAFFYHLGDIVYFAGDIDKYGDNFYQTYFDYPGFIVGIPGNHDCQPDDPLDGPVDPNKKPLDGFVQNFMAPTPNQPGSLKTGAGRTQMDLPNVFWTFTTPLATILGLFSNVGETEGEIHQDQIDWFKSELVAADPGLALIVTVHHPPFSGDQEHSGSSAVEGYLSSAFADTGRYPDLVLSGHVHNYQRFTQKLTIGGAPYELPFVVAGAGGYTRLGKLHKIGGQYPQAPLDVSADLRLEQYDQDNFGFLRLEVDQTTITGTYLSAPYQGSTQATASVVEQFTINRTDHTVATVGA